MCGCASAGTNCGAAVGGVAGLPWLYYDTIESARTLMFVVAGAMIGVIGVVFSITEV